MIRKRISNMPPLLAGAAAGKWVAFCMGMAMFFLLPDSVADITLLDRWAVVFWYATVGGVVGVSNVVKQEPISGLPVPWWLRAPLLGAWMHLMVVLFAGEGLQNLVLVIHATKGALISPYWFVLDGLLIGFVVGFISTDVERRQAARLADVN